VDPDPRLGGPRQRGVPPASDDQTDSENSDSLDGTFYVLHRAVPTAEFEDFAGA
jgi:hypothetical protein